MNIKLKINPLLLLRIPAFSMTEDLAEVWEEFKVSIRHSSSSFYDKIKAFSVDDIPNFDNKTQYTIWKYFNRSKYRGTPFGQFAGFAVANLSSGEEKLVFSKKQHFHRFKDWSRCERGNVSETELSALHRIYFSNSSHYRAGDHIRFISLEDNAFELSEINYSEFIQDLLVFCAEKVSYASILEFALIRAVVEEVLLGILKAMLDSQLLFTDLDANIIGPDYFKRIDEIHQDSPDDYLIAEREVVSGSLSKAALSHLPSCINALLDLNLSKVNKGVKDFIYNFNKQYEGCTMPLMQILDPELGIGYGEFTTVAGASGLVKELNTHQKPKAPAALPWSEFHNALLKAMFKVSGDSSQILQLRDLITPSAEKSILKLANSFSVLAKFSGDLLVLDSMGGCTANALAGRFTTANESFGRHCRKIAEGESSANPGVIFFDIAYMAEGRVDNINRRAQIYEYELPILNYSCSDRVISLNDVLVTVQGEEVVLLSKKYGKRLIPRLASAYNYSRSDLSVYRFLCDLQHQGIQSQLLFDIQELLPDLDRYPRIQYENIVLSPAKWRVRRLDLEGVEFLTQLEKMGLPRYFSVGEGDQTLCFDRAKTTDVFFLKQYAKHYDDFVVTEVIVSDKQYFSDDCGKYYFTQVLLSMSHDEEIYPGYISSNIKDNTVIDSVIVPGKDWLSYEIYCHPGRSNFLLSERIGKFMKVHEDAFKTWFFIRYNKPAPHLRLRIQMKDQQCGYFYMNKLMELFDADLKEGLIKDIQLKTYYREIARYGANQMIQTEQHFKKDSQYAMDVFLLALDDFSIYANCIRMMKSALELLPFERKDLMAFIRRMQRAFEQEHQLDSDTFKMVNREWLDFNTQVQLKAENLKLPFYDLENSFLDTLNATAAKQRPSLFSSLFHMHINRLFFDYQRTHELLIYSFLYKQLQMEQHKLALI